MRGAAAFLILALMLPACASAQEPVSGPAKMRDATTLSIGGVRIRLAGVRCPGDAACTDAAARRLAGLLDGGPLTCSRARRLGHGIYAGRCSLADGTDLALMLLQEGLLEPTGDAPADYLGIEPSNAPK